MYNEPNFSVGLIYTNYVTHELIPHGFQHGRPRLHYVKSPNLWRVEDTTGRWTWPGTIL